MATKQKLTTLGIELGSTRIKAVLTSFNGTILASGMHDWENRFEDGYWTYHLDDVWAGIRDAYRDLALNYENTYGEVLQTVGAMVTTPQGAPVAMVHCNTCTSDLDGWVNLMGEMTEAAGTTLTKSQLYNLFYQKALQGDADCGVPFISPSSTQPRSGFLHQNGAVFRALGVE